MRQCYVAVSFQKKENFRGAIDAVCQTLMANAYAPIVFVDRYQFTAAETKVMMQQAFSDIQHSALLIAEVSDKAIGIGIEVGYAVAENIPIIYLRRSDAEHSTTVAGCADSIIIYKNEADLSIQLQKVLDKLNR